MDLNVSVIKNEENTNKVLIKESCLEGICYILCSSLYLNKLCMCSSKMKRVALLESANIF